MKIKNWSHFQHFKDRRPPWIKLYREILDDMEWHQLDPLASKVLVMCWLIASENDGNLPDIKTLAFRLRMTEKQTFECVSKLNHWVEQDDINVISDRHQDDAPETEKRQRQKVEKPESVSDNVWDSFVQHRKQKKAVITDLVLSAIAKESEKAGWTLDAAMTEMVTRNWTGFKAEWVANKPSAQQAFSKHEAEKARLFR